MRITRLIFGSTGAALLLGSAFLWQAQASSSNGTPTVSAEAPAEKRLSPEDRMKMRFPQPVRVGDLIGLRVNDWNDSIIGYIQQVVRTPAGKIELVVPYHPWFGWIPNGSVMDGRRRPVAMPLETVAIRGRQIDALEMSRDDFEAASTSPLSERSVVPADEQILIAITRR
jgi:hypothetical protein